MEHYVKAIIREARELCGCYACSGPLEIGALLSPDRSTFTTAGGSTRLAPSSCVAPTLLEWMLRAGEPRKERSDGE